MNLICTGCSSSPCCCEDLRIAQQQSIQNSSACVYCGDAAFNHPRLGIHHVCVDPIKDAKRRAALDATWANMTKENHISPQERPKMNNTPLNYSTLVENLRKVPRGTNVMLGDGWRLMVGKICSDAADEIERLRAALETISESYCGQPETCPIFDQFAIGVARAALRGETGPKPCPTPAPTSMSSQDIWEVQTAAEARAEINGETIQKHVSALEQLMPPGQFDGSK